MCWGLGLPRWLIAKEEVKLLSRVRLFATPWTVAQQALSSMGFSRQEYWSGLPFPSPEELPDLGIEPGSPALRAGALPSEPPGKPRENQFQTTARPGEDETITHQGPNQAGPLCPLFLSSSLSPGGVRNTI